jgi:hypothetical protein
MVMAGKGGKKSTGGRNDDRPNGKAWKKTPGDPKQIKKSNPKYVEGYTLIKLAIRDQKRKGVFDDHADTDRASESN